MFSAWGWLLLAGLCGSSSLDAAGSGPAVDAQNASWIETLFAGHHGPSFSCSPGSPVHVKQEAVLDTAYSQETMILPHFSKNLTLMKDRFSWYLRHGCTQKRLAQNAGRCSLHLGIYFGDGLTSSLLRALIAFFTGLFWDCKVTASGVQTHIATTTVVARSSPTKAYYCHTLDPEAEKHEALLGSGLRPDFWWNSMACFEGDACFWAERWLPEALLTPSDDEIRRLANFSVQFDELKKHRTKDTYECFTPLPGHLPRVLPALLFPDTVSHGPRAWANTSNLAEPEHIVRRKFASKLEPVIARIRQRFHTAAAPQRKTCGYEPKSKHTIDVAVHIRRGDTFRGEAEEGLQFHVIRFIHDVLRHTELQARFHIQSEVANASSLVQTGHAPEFPASLKFVQPDLCKTESSGAMSQTRFRAELSSADKSDPEGQPSSPVPIHVMLNTDPMLAVDCMGLADVLVLDQHSSFSVLAAILSKGVKVFAHPDPRYGVGAALMRARFIELVRSGTAPEEWFRVSEDPERIQALQPGLEHSASGREFLRRLRRNVS